MAGDDPPAKRLKVEGSTHFGQELGNSLVEIHVGPSKEHFSVHKKILRDKSAVFQKMFGGNFKEGLEQAVTLPEDDPATFALFVHWIYSGTLKKIDIKQHDPPEYDAFLVHVRLYGFAEKICLPTLMDHTMTVLISSYAMHVKNPTLEAAVTAYRTSTPDSPIRRFMSRHFIFYLTQFSDEKAFAGKASEGTTT